MHTRRRRRRHPAATADSGRAVDPRAPTSMTVALSEPLTDPLFGPRGRGAGPAVLRAHLFAATQRIALVLDGVTASKTMRTRSFPSRTSSTRRCSVRTTCCATVSVGGADAFHPWTAPSRRVYVTGGLRRGRRIGAVATLAVRQALVSEVPPGTFSTSALRGTGGSIEFRVRRRRPRLRIALTKRAGASGRGVVDAGPAKNAVPGTR